MSLPTVLPEPDRVVLTARVNQATRAQRDVLRARIVLDSEHHSVRVSAIRLQRSRTTVLTCRRRYRDHGLQGLVERTRSGAPATNTDAGRRDRGMIRTCG